MSFADVEPTAVRRARWSRPTDPIEFTPTPFPPGLYMRPVATNPRSPRWTVIAAAIALMGLVAACAGFL